MVSLYRRYDKKGNLLYVRISPVGDNDYATSDTIKCPSISIALQGVVTDLGKDYVNVVAGCTHPRQCPKCGARFKDHVIDSRNKLSGSTRRRRECLVCGERWTTAEVRVEV